MYLKIGRELRIHLCDLTPEEGLYNASYGEHDSQKGKYKIFVET